jgi:hypothetical protein
MKIFVSTDEKLPAKGMGDPATTGAPVGGAVTIVAPPAAKGELSETLESVAPLAGGVPLISKHPTRQKDNNTETPTKIARLQMSVITPPRLISLDLANCTDGPQEKLLNSYPIKSNIYILCCAA